MPFMGRDWRSPGEAWVKTESLGWQRMKIVESQLHLSACHASQPACSWPPPSQFGQHMAENCAGGQLDSDMSCDQTDGGACRRRRAPNSVEDESASSSGSERSSASASPTSSPEKGSANNGNNASRHIHRPITISSPYGRYSASYCDRHFHPPISPTRDAANKARPASEPIKINCTNHACRRPEQTDQVQMRKSPKSLSRQMLSPFIDNNNGPAANLAAHDDDDDDAAKPRLLRHNKSAPNFESAFCATAEEAESDPHLQPPPDGVPSAATKQSVASKEPPTGNQLSPAQSTSSLPARWSPADSDGGRWSPGCCCCCDSSCQQPDATTKAGPASGRLAAQPEAPRPQPQASTAPHCRISVRTREVAMHNTISEAFYRLDFYNAIHDIRRFNYICKLLHLLITQNLTSLSGCATRVLFTMLEQVAWEVSANKRNINVIRDLLADLRQTIQKYYCWGRPIGSSLLWQQHFETIERISQIVDEIELSPPKAESCQATFDKLPVEMIREILLRLNDYRDLVNSAQASPVMRTMIDNQCVWQKLCRYHFSDQQLKLALESNKFHFVKKQQQSGHLRGIKYARTTSADGRSSYRSPVAAAARGGSQAAASNRLQSETGERQSGQAGDSARPTTARNNQKSSYVTNAVRIFDKQERAAPARLQSALAVRQASSAGPSRRPAPPSASSALSLSSPPSTSSSCSPPPSNGLANDTAARQTLEIDWERVFHQLRKRFDLKEEYADCLLLCRHCRCLFWKSFGHPCIKSDEPIGTCCGPDNLTIGGDTNGPSSGPGEHNCERRNRSRERNQAGAPSAAGADAQGRRGASLSGARRLSVALLSRNFDRRALASGAHEGVANGNSNAEDNAENISPDDGRAPEPLAASIASSSRRLDNGAGRPGAAPATFAPRQQPPIESPSAQLREQNHQRGQDWQRRPLSQPQQARRQDAGRPAADRKQARPEELVPKHVTISPQAFLKFFSL